MLQIHLSWGLCNQNYLDCSALQVSATTKTINTKWASPYLSTKIVCKTFARFFMCLQVFRSCRMCLDPFGPIWTCSDAFVHVGMHTEASRSVWTNSERLDFCSHIFWYIWCVLTRFFVENLDTYVLRCLWRATIKLIDRLVRFHRFDIRKNTKHKGRHCWAK